MDYLTDTSFLVDLWRERQKPGVAIRFVEEHGRAVVGLPWVAKGEFLRGAALAGQAHEAVQVFLSAFLVVWPSEDTLRRYADIYADLRKLNAMIGPNDLWIAASAAEKGLPLLTRNAAHFSRIAGLSVVDYSTS